jgi:hypothetical protein
MELKKAFCSWLAIYTSILKRKKKEMKTKLIASQII